MNKQEMFDTAVLGILNQGGISISEDGICLYRNPNGRKCAAGFLIPDEYYYPDMEKKIFSALAFKLPDYLQKHSNFIGILQSIHDGFKYKANYTLRDIQERYIKFGKECDLDTSRVENWKPS